MQTYRRIPADPADWFDADEVKKAKTYQRPVNVVRFVSGALGLALLLVLISTNAVVKLADNIAGGSWPMRLVVVGTFLVIVFMLFDLPFSIWTTFVHEKKWGFSTETPKGFAGDQVKSLVLGLVLQLLLLFPLWWLIRRTELWWVFGWGVFFLFAVLLAFLYPILIAPIFNKFTPLADEELSAKLRALAEGVGMRVKGVEVMDASKRTRKDNAYFAGLGRTRQIVLYDNLLAYAQPSVVSVVAHELGHWRRRHVTRSIILGTVTSFLLFYVLYLVSKSEAALNWAGVESFGDPAALPLVFLVFGTVSVITGLIQSWFSRAYERQADLEALELTNDYDAFMDVERTLSTKNLIDLAPNWWRYLRASHPPPAERMQLAVLWQQERQKV